MENRVCTKCKEEKEFCFFDKTKKTKSGIRSVCKTCRVEERKKYKKENPDYKKNYYQKNRDTILIRTNEYKKINKDKILEKAKIYRESNKEKVNISKRNSTKKRFKNDGFFRLSQQLRKYVKRYFNSTGKSKKTMEIVGCSPEYLKEHISSKFESWMSWDNYGYGKGKWVIDHIIPLSSAKNKEDLYKLCYFSNLRPLSWEENMIKSNKILI
jgi:hypothetical protein